MFTHARQDIPTSADDSGFSQKLLALVQVRMMSKGVLKAVVPWDSTRRVLAARLRCRIAEDSLVRKITGADAALTRAQALQCARAWRRDGSAAPLDGADVSAQVPESLAAQQQEAVETASPAAHVSDVGLSRIGSEGKHSRHGSSSESAAVSLAVREQREVSESRSDSGDGADASTGALVTEADAFVAWAESATGAARVGAELRILRQRAARRTVADAAATDEGREGLLAVVGELARGDARMRARLETLLSQPSAPAQ